MPERVKLYIAETTPAFESDKTVIRYDDGLGWLSETGWDPRQCVSIFDSYFSGYSYHNVLCYNTGIIGKKMPILTIRCIGKLSSTASYPYPTLTPPNVAVSVTLS